MSDYLSRAAQRASHVPTAVRPALPSAFDSDRSFSAPADNSSFAPADVEAANNLRVEPAGNPPAAADQAGSVRERIAALQGLWTEPAQPPLQTREAGAKQTSVGVMGAPVVVPKSTNPAALQPDAPKNGAVSAQSKNTFSPREPARDSFSPLAEKPCDTPPATLTERAREDSPSPVIGKTMAPRPAPPQASPPLSKRPVFPERKAGPKFRSSPDPLAPDHNAPSSAGTIHVTIGRVEVRAIHPPAEPRPPRPPPKPTLSLDDYLKQRKRGARE